MLLGLKRALSLSFVLALVADALRDVTNRGDIVLDCFSGSGTTIIAAAKTGRRARVIELDPHYVDVASCRRETPSTSMAKSPGPSSSICMRLNQLGRNCRRALKALARGGRGARRLQCR
ncbi:MAG: site-specific DNA-methyltransferase [Caulobacterales bacterium]|nr:site-specific DNA-methyltransferase [Caulobacterales bacterium]